MPRSPLRVVLDTNVILRGLLGIRSPAGRVLQLAERGRVTLLLSKPVMDEYRSVLTDAEIVDRFPELTPQRVEVALRRLRYLSDYARVVRARFDFPRDPRDEIFIVLAISGEATDIVSLDNDLLSLPTGRGGAAKRLRQRLPRVRVLRPEQFLEVHAPLLGGE